MNKKRAGSSFPAVWVSCSCIYLAPILFYRISCAQTAAVLLPRHEFWPGLLCIFQSQHCWGNFSVLDEARSPESNFKNDPTRFTSAAHSPFPHKWRQAAEEVKRFPCREVARKPMAEWWSGAAQGLTSGCVTCVLIFAVMTWSTTSAFAQQWQIQLHWHYSNTTSRDGDTEYPGRHISWPTILNYLVDSMYSKEKEPKKAKVWPGWENKESKKKRALLASLLHRRTDWWQDLEGSRVRGDVRARPGTVTNSSALCWEQTTALPELHTKKQSETPFFRQPSWNTTKKKKKKSQYSLTSVKEEEQGMATSPPLLIIQHRNQLIMASISSKGIFLPHLTYKTLSPANDILFIAVVFAVELIGERL